MRTTIIALCVMALGAGLGPQSLALHNDTREGDSGEAAAKAAVVDRPDPAFPSFPKVRLAAVRGRDGGEAIDLEVVAARARAWARQGESAADPLLQARYFLAAANSVLSYEPAGALTQLVLELHPDHFGMPDERNSETARRAINEASQWLDKARTLLAESSPGGEEVGDIDMREIEGDKPQPEEVERDLADFHRLDRTASTLAAFSQAFDALLVPPDDPSAYRRSREAATALAPILEDSDPAVSAAAKLWQSALRSREDDPTPALLRLELVNVATDRQTQPYAFFSRLMRCRLIAEHGNTPAGMALLLQLEERCHDWFVDVERRDEALRTVGLIKMRILRGWHGRAKADGLEVESAWCADRARDVMEKHFDDGEAKVMPLAPTIPILIDAPSVAAPTESTSPPSD